jgi:hypothetical protein
MEPAEKDITDLRQEALSKIELIEPGNNLHKYTKLFKFDFSIRLIFYNLDRFATSS